MVLLGTEWNGNRRWTDRFSDPAWLISQASGPAPSSFCICRDHSDTLVDAGKNGLRQCGDAGLGRDIPVACHFLRKLGASGAVDARHVHACRASVFRSLDAGAHASKIQHPGYLPLSAVKHHHATCYRIVPTQLFQDLDFQSSGLEGCVEISAVLMRPGVPIHSRRQEADVAVWLDGATVSMALAKRLPEPETTQNWMSYGSEQRHWTK
ncbi:hypothetical protein CA85_14280 [Allorhodopirellula solitaria]|uniref:Uncharacterized protein n=1 Tax=Allorhodopirellula solitaria TaxID=2527987 RepID=A0A5C5YB94_9BACT|nr:hypothetical protein CA85_14280 [Allorhodopirellula solitaria]